MTAGQLAKLVEQGLQLVGAGEREDLRRRLGQAMVRLQDPSIRVIVVGEFKQGKSKLINALVNAPVCPVDDDIATSLPTIVRYGEPASAAVLVPTTDTSAGDAHGLAAADGVERRPIELSDLPAL